MEDLKDARVLVTGSDGFIGSHVVEELVRAGANVKAVNDAGCFAFVVTNQSDVARGIYEESHVQALHRWMADGMAAVGAHIDAFEYCPDHPDGTIARYRRVSDRRKPGPGMITDLLGSFAVDAEGSLATRPAISMRPRPPASRGTFFRAVISKPL
ncbi:NAD-dependent epimerase/dehydratase family protein [Bradyrhizobium sp. AUGA SZCCT0240]|uniref:NAD-dependent epimerase/dehydratase family protein n=1 Tax=Bradyrhizobium sp. AUGA SZCCT0240 TaxID=2807669 RepID=UPI0020139626|nr:NAD-dependent epimerase/dehydratase family protein [Bradyrhizobium sp. AUGA SZCCT0240]